MAYNNNNEQLKGTFQLRLKNSEAADLPGSFQDEVIESAFNTYHPSQRFSDKATEKAFEKHFAEKYLNQVRLSIFVGLIGFLLFYAIAFYVDQDPTGQAMVFMNAIPLYITPLFIAFFLVTLHSSAIPRFQLYLSIGVNLVNLIWVHSIYKHMPPGTGATLGLGVFIIIMTFNYVALRLRFYWSLASGLILSLNFLIPSYGLLVAGVQSGAFSAQHYWLSSHFSHSGPYFYQVGIIVVFNAIGAVSAYFFGRLERQSYLRKTIVEDQKKLLQAEQQRSESLLLNILPRHVAKQLLHSQEKVIEHYDSLSILFVGIAGFSQLFKPYSSKELVRLVNEIFGEFDKIVEKHNGEKIKTIGDTYMAVCGLYGRENHCELAAQIALDIQKYISKLRDKNGKPIQIRIGMHCGPAVAGVIGSHKFAFDIWGSSVNIASRMESQGEPGKTQLSDTIHKHLSHSFLTERRGNITIKGKGEMDTWWLKHQTSS